MKLEELLNSLIKGGWKPRGENEPIYMLSSKKLYIPDTMEVNRSLRDLVSKESGLWQFCVKNKLVKTKDRKVRYRYEDLEKTQNYFSWYGYEYRLIESALCNEEDLEKFLLENIKIS